MIEMLKANLPLLMTFIGIISACVGSFLNVVIYRLPKLLETNWRKECELLLNVTIETSSENLSLFFPSSHCTNCKTPIKWYQNLPIISFLLLRGKCAYCQQPISKRYFTVEMLSLISGVFLAWFFGFSLSLLFSLIFTWYLIAMTFIDLDKQILPDELTLGLLWLGLFSSIFYTFSAPTHAIIGALTGYLTFYIVAALFQLMTKREGMGYGDFKLLAALGAWQGWQTLPMIVLLASLLGSIAGVTLLLKEHKPSSRAFAFGPYLAIAGWISLLWGQDFIHWYLSLFY
ncbi:MAG: prepilin peptidase [Gammaproteobacteria bacterium]